MTVPTISLTLGWTVRVADFDHFEFPWMFDRGAQSRCENPLPGADVLGVIRPRAQGSCQMSVGCPFRLPESPSR